MELVHLEWDVVYWGEAGLHPSAASWAESVHQCQYLLVHTKR